MSKVVQFRLGDRESRIARERAVRITDRAALVMERDRPEAWCEAVARASVLQAMYRQNFWNGSIYGPIDQSRSPFVVLAALVFMQTHLDDIADLFELVGIAPEQVVSAVVKTGMPIAEKLGRPGGAA